MLVVAVVIVDVDVFFLSCSCVLFCMGGGQDCGMIRDFQNPTVRLPASVANGANLNPTDENAIETVSASYRRQLFFFFWGHSLKIVANDWGRRPHACISRWTRWSQQEVQEGPPPTICIYCQSGEIQNKKYKTKTTESAKLGGRSRLSGQLVGFEECNHYTPTVVVPWPNVCVLLYAGPLVCVYFSCFVRSSNGTGAMKGTPSNIEQ